MGQVAQDGENEGGEGKNECDSGIDDLAGGSFVGEGGVDIESIGEEDGADPRHEGQTSYDKVEAPGFHSIYPALSIPSTIEDGPVRPCLNIMVEYFLAQLGEKSI